MGLRIIIYEDNDILRESIISMLSLNDQFEVAGAYNNVLGVEEQMKTTRPDCILMDIDMPGMTGIEALPKIRKIKPEVPVIMLTVFDDNFHVLTAIQSGATGYLLKKHISTKLFDAIQDVMEGGSPMSPAVARMVIDSMQHKRQDIYNLTAREREILASLSQGNSYKMISAAMNISIDTVRTHIKKIYEKLQVHSQTEAVSKAINEKLV